jgi:tetratricopeptide (TPR) repeat protein
MPLLINTGEAAMPHSSDPGSLDFHGLARFGSEPDAPARALTGASGSACGQIPQPGGEPQDAAAYNQQAISFALEGRFEEAFHCLQQVLRLQPASAEAWINLGNLLSLQELYEDAAASYRQALCLNPTLAEAYSNLGSTLSCLGRYEEAVTNCQQAIRLRPNYAKAYSHLGDAYKGLGRLDEAIGCYHQALALDPILAEAHNNLGAAHVEVNQLKEAVASYREALRLDPDSATVCSNLGGALVRRAELDDALALLQKAVRLQPNNAQVHYNLGYALGEQGQLEESQKHFHQAIQLKPDFADAHLALAQIWLSLGDFERGWREYEWRFRRPAFTPWPCPQPVWDGSCLAGRTILLHAEGGLGDTIHFVRYAANIKQNGGTVLVGCQTPLVPLLTSCRSIDGLVASGSAPPPFDVQAPIMSLPRILKTSLSTVPAEVPYLWPDAKLEDAWRHQLSRHPGFKVGIVWQGSFVYTKNRQRSIPLSHFAPLARVEGVCLISLQKGFGSEQLRTVGDQFPVIDLGNQFDEHSGAFMDTAAIMKSLDLVITSDTSIAHLAGALEVPVWVALCFVPEWRWLLERADSPWYPTMRLFRQTKPGDWDGVFARMAIELSGRVEVCNVAAKKDHHRHRAWRADRQDYHPGDQVGEDPR